MANEGDYGNEAADLFREVALENARIQDRELLTGFCKWCDEPTSGAFCSASCRTDYNKRENMRR